MALKIDRDAFREKFEAEGLMHYKIYEGATTARTKRLRASDSPTSVDNSLEEIEQFFNLFPKGATMTIVTGKSENAKNNNAICVTWGNGGIESKIGGTNTNIHASMSPQLTQMTQMAQLFKMMQPAQTGLSPELLAMINSNKELEIKMARLENELNNERAYAKALEEQEPAINPLLGRAVDAIDKFGTMYMTQKGMKPASQGALGTIGEPTKGQDKTQNMNTQKNTETQETKAPKKANTSISMDRLFNSAARVQRQYPEYSVNDLMDRLADFIEKSKPQADGVIITLMTMPQDENN